MNNIFKPKHNRYDWERSEKLIEATDFDWEITEFAGKLFIVSEDGAVLGEGTLYDPDNMALAWLLHLWMLDQESGARESPYAVMPKPYREWWDRTLPWVQVPAQRRWLDKILELLP
jgi:hypothetical protein